MTISSEEFADSTWVDNCRRQGSRTGWRAVAGVFSGLGHGIGLGWDSPWLISGEDMSLTSDMVINIERTLTRDGYLGDFEETILITEDGPELLTNAKQRYW